MSIQEYLVQAENLKGSALSNFNKLHSRGSDGRFGSKVRATVTAATESIEDSIQVAKDFAIDIKESAENIPDPDHLRNGVAEAIGDIPENIAKTARAAAASANKLLGDAAKSLSQIVERKPVKGMLDKPSNPDPAYEAVVAQITASLKTAKILTPPPKGASKAAIAAYKSKEKRLVNDCIQGNIDNEMIAAGAKQLIPNPPPALNVLEGAARAKEIAAIVAEFKQGAARISDNPNIRASFPNSSYMLGIKLLLKLASVNDPKVAKQRAVAIDLQASLHHLQPEHVTYIQQQFEGVFAITGKDLPIGKMVLDPARSAAFPTTRQILLPMDLGTEHFRTVLFHESAHFSEFDNPDVAATASDFVKRRATGPEKSLKEMTGLPYADSEVAYPDAFEDPYAGKLYREKDGAPDFDTTEIHSRGFEHFASPISVVELYKKDPEHFQLIIDWIAQDQRELDKEVAETKRKRAAGIKFRKEREK